MLSIREIIVPEYYVNDAFEQEHIEFYIEDEEEISVNDYSIFISEENTKHKALVRYLGNSMWSKVNSRLVFNGIKPKDSYQAAFMDSLANDKTLVNIAVGSAGTGKTTLALAYAVHKYTTEKRRILLSKPATMVGQGKAFGAVPGDFAEKYAPYLSSYDIVLKKIMGENSKAGDKNKGEVSVYLEAMKNKGDLQFIPIELARGCTYDNCTFILDEAQNMTWHELNTIVSRIGENSKIILLGDPKQIDIKLRTTETGLWKLMTSPPFQESFISSAIQLKTQYRSPITQLVADVHEYLREREYGEDLDGVLIGG